MGKVVGARVPNEDPERLKRVLDAKYRTIGIDADALAKQTAEKKEREAAEKARDAAYDQLSNYYADQVQLQQQEADRLAKAKKDDLERFRQENQLKFTRKEWDLNRPDGKLIDTAARVGDDDPRLGPASLQKFDGEDLSAGDRKAAQHDQAKSWWEEQAAQKAALKAAEAEAEAAHAELVKYQDSMQMDAHAQEAALRRAMDASTMATNMRLAEEKRARERHARDSELAASNAEMNATMTDPMMTEDPNQAASALSAYRVRKDHFKGMSEAEKRAVNDTQLAQMEEARAKRAAEAAEEAAYARTQSDIQRALAAQAGRVDDFRKAQALRSQDVLRKQMEDKAQRDKDLSSLYKNKIDDTYFQQFGTSHR